MRLKILDRYILSEMVGPFFIGLVVYSLLFLVNLLFQLVSLAIQQGLPPGTTLSIFLLSLPSLLSYTLPIAVLLATIMAFSRLSGDSEVIALQSSGIKLRSLLKAPIILAALVSLTLVSLNLWLIPAARSAADRIQAGAAEAIHLVRLLKPGTFFDRIPGVLLYCDQTDLGNNSYKNIFIYQKMGEGQEVVTMADWAMVLQSKSSGILQFIAGNGQTLQFDRKKPGKVNCTDFEKQTLTLQLTPQEADRFSKKSLSELYPSDIIERIKEPPQVSDPVIARQEKYILRHELHRRLAGAALPIFFALVGLPLGLVNLRGGKGAGFTLSMLIVLCYWILLSALSDMAKAGKILPELAAWFPGLAVLAISAPLIMVRERLITWKRPRFLDLWDSGRERAEQALPAVPSPFRLVKILDAYLLKKLIYFLIVICASMLMLDWVIEARGLSEFISKTSHWKLLGTYLLNQSPAVLYLLMPIAVPLTVLVAYGIMERNSELLAMKASGISLHRVSAPALFLAGAVCFLMWGLGETAVPPAARKAQRSKDRIKNTASRNLASYMDVWVFAPDRKSLYHYNFYSPQSSNFQGFSLYTIDKGNFRVASRLFAKSATPAGHSSLNFRESWVWAPKEAEPFKQKKTGRLDLKLPLSYFVVPPFLEAQYFSTKELRKLVVELDKKGYPSITQKVDLFKKSADAAAPFFLLLASLPFAFSTGRRGSLHGIAIAIGISIIYYLLSAVFRAVGQMQWLDPALSAWAPDIFLGFMGGYLLINLRT